MKNLITILFFLININLSAQINFDDYFENKTLRLDYTIGGNSDTSYVFFEQFKEEQYWGGSLKNLIDKFNFGDFRVLVYDSSETKLIYSRGYSTLFYEWIDTKEAKNLSRSYYESVTVPFPKKEINICLEMRNNKNEFLEIFKIKLNPDNYFIVKDKQQKYPTQKLHYSGNHNQKLDIVIIPDGYTETEMVKFYEDCKKFMDYFFDVEPFKTHKDKVNFWSVYAVSEESGTDIPGKNIWKNTVLNTHFYTFDSERYLTTNDIKTLRDIAAYVPYDQIYILVNTAKYGGGGIYNYYNLCSADHSQSGRVFTHEFGHAFTALADEYTYGFETAEEIYDLSVEPWQVNITSLTDFSKKWKDLTEKNTPIPTPDTQKYENKIGAFEGAGYVKKKMYRPAKDCKMRSNSTDEFCPVCYRTVLEMLMFYAD